MNEAVVIDTRASTAEAMNSAAARLWRQARKAAVEAKGPGASRSDLDFNAMSASLQAVIGHATRRGLPDHALAIAIGAACGPLLATLPREARLDWIQGLIRVMHAAAGLSDLALEEPQQPRLI